MLPRREGKTRKSLVIEKLCFNTRKASIGELSFAYFFLENFIQKL